jgi:ATP-dependent DNA helicase PIF1
MRQKSMGNYPVLGRIYYIPPGTKFSEEYFLRCLLTIRPGIGSYEEIVTYNGITYNTFIETCAAMGLLQNDKEWIHCMEDFAAVETNIHKLRELFVMILCHNNPADALQLWNRFKEELSYDFKFQRIEFEINQYQLLIQKQLLETTINNENKGTTANFAPPDNNTFTEDDFDRALYAISDILTTKEHKVTLESLHLPLPTKQKNLLEPFFPDTIYAQDTHTYFISQQHIQQQQQQQQQQQHKERFEEMNARMNTDQKRISETLIESLKNLDDINLPKCFFLDAPGGTGKTFTLNTFISYVLALKIPTIVTGYSGVASNLLINGRTCHSQFKFPLNQDTKDCNTGNLKAREKLGKQLFEAKVIIIDEGPMLSRKLLELLHYDCIQLYKTFNKLGLEDSYSTPFAGKVIIIAGDFRQTLPILRWADRTRIVQNVINRSFLWPYFKTMKLTINERVMRNATTLPQELKTQYLAFSEKLLQLGDGNIPYHDENKELIDLSTVIETHTIQDLTLTEFVRWCYPELETDVADRIQTSQKAILCPLNSDVDEVNKIALELMKGNCYDFYSADVVHDEETNPVQDLHSLTVQGIPDHKLRVKVGCPVILLRNLDPVNGLCNGTKLVITKIISLFSIQAQIESGSHKGEIANLSRINFTTAETDFPFIMTRRQFPIRIAFAMSINKSQGQSLLRVGLYLKGPIFSHGQLYVAGSRAGIPSETKCLINCTNNRDNEMDVHEDNKDKRKNDGSLKENKSRKCLTNNIVWKEVFTPSIN